MEKTVAAISTAVGSSGIGIVRISGPQAMEIISKIYRPAKQGKEIKKVPTHTIHYGYIYDHEEPVDEVLVMVMRAPHSYTGEDTVEIDCHGGIRSVRNILQTVLEAGAELAAPGEFSKRAFLNGRMDLSQAEAVMDLIQAKNDHALQNSLRQLKGSLRTVIEKIRADILYETAFIESALDDPEHISLEGYSAKLKPKLEEMIQRLEHLIRTSEDGKMIREGIRTVILGKPNAGKSSLMNRLLGEERAIVTDIPGTTRDILEEYIHLDGITLRIVDTAGIRKTEDTVERIGVERAREMAGRADLLLYVVDSSSPLDENDREILSILDNRKAVVLYNKTDLDPAVDMELIRRETEKPVIPVSAKEGTGISLLQDTIREMFFSGEVSMEEEIYITNARHTDLLTKAEKSLENVLEAVIGDLPEDLYTVDLMDAYENLGYITGEAVEEDLINEIFSRFCVGK